MYAQAAIKQNTLLRNGAYGIVMRGVQKCTCAGASLRGRNSAPLCCIKLDTATDPCMGSGHILVYAFDVLMQIYESAGYSQRDAAKSILEHNIYGLDIDDRAYQLAYFAVMMKARQYNRRILNGENTCHVYAIQESNSINRAHLKYFGAGMDDIEKNAAKMQLEGLLDTLTDAKEYGSILNVESYNWELLRRFVAAEDTAGQISMDSVGVEETAEQLNRLIDIGETMARKYWVTVTNPPYAGMSKMNAKLNNFVQDNYADYKSDMFSAFVVKCSTMTLTNGFCAFLTPYVWMFIQSYEKMRKYLYANTTIETLIQFEYSAFEEATVPICTFAFRKGYIAKKGCYLRLTDFRGGMEVQREKTLEAISNHECGFYYEQKSDDFAKIPGAPVAYWVSNAIYTMFNNKQLMDYMAFKEGITTGDNDIYLRVWHEVAADSIFFNNAEVLTSTISWIPCNKGGEFRRWYGNRYYIIDWTQNGMKLKNFKRSSFRNAEYQRREGGTFSNLSSGLFGARYSEAGFAFESKGTMFFGDSLFDVLAYVNTKVFGTLLGMVCPTLDFKFGVIQRLPYKPSNTAESITKQCINLSKSDWDSFETSWDFMVHPLVRCKSFSPEEVAEDAKHNIVDMNYVEEAVKRWSNECYLRFQKLKENEEELNRIFIDIYGLQDELTPEVEDKDITVHRVFENRDEVPDSMKNSNYTRTYRDEIVSLLSYAVGCMFGRYSIYKDGLLFAGEPYSLQAFVDKMNDRPGTISADELERAYRNEGVVVDEMFFPDADNVIPITDEEYLDDDIVSRLCAWLKAVYGADTLEANLDYIAKALGNKGSTSREIIRNYFLNDFFKDHCQTYSVTGSGKRPIYWLFDSGKQNGFKALVYLHRYTPDTIGNLRIDYLHKMQRVYESEINRMQDMMDHSENAREVAAAGKRKDKLAKQLKECREYDEKISHLALSRIELDLDDGVKVNYRKLQTAQDGKFYEVLADSKNIMVKEKK